MASKRKSRPKANATPKKSRRIYRPDGFLWVGLIINILAGLMLSPMTSLTRIRVVGAEPFDRQRIEGELTALGGKPVASIKPRAVETSLASAPEVRDVDFTRNWFGRGQVKITYNKPVAKVAGAKALFLSDEGVLYTSRQKTGPLPTTDLPESVNRAALTFAMEAPLQPLGELCAHIPSSIDCSSSQATFQMDKGLCLNTGEGSALIVFGPADRMNEKLASLDQFLKENPRLLKENSEVNLIVPEKATRTPLPVVGTPKP